MERQQDETKKVLVTSVTHDSGGIRILVQQNRSRARTLMHAMTPRAGNNQAQRMLHTACRTSKRVCHGNNDAASVRLALELQRNTRRENLWLHKSRAARLGTRMSGRHSRKLENTASVPANTDLSSVGPHDTHHTQQRRCLHASFSLARGIFLSQIWRPSSEPNTKNIHSSVYQTIVQPSVGKESEWVGGKKTPCLILPRSYQEGRAGPQRATEKYTTSTGKEPNGFNGFNGFKAPSSGRRLRSAFLPPPPPPRRQRAPQATPPPPSWRRIWPARSTSTRRIRTEHRPTATRRRCARKLRPKSRY